MGFPCMDGCLEAYQTSHHIYQQSKGTQMNKPNNQLVVNQQNSPLDVIFVIILVPIKVDQSFDDFNVSGHGFKTIFSLSTGTMP